MAKIEVEDSEWLELKSKVVELEGQLETQKTQHESALTTAQQEATTSKQKVDTLTTENAKYKTKVADFEKRSEFSGRMSAIKDVMDSIESKTGKKLDRIFLDSFIEQINKLDMTKKGTGEFGQAVIDEILEPAWQKQSSMLQRQFGSEHIPGGSYITPGDQSQTQQQTDTNTEVVTTGSGVSPSQEQLSPSGVMEKLTSGFGEM